MSKRKLSLDRENLTELSTTELTEVIGAEAQNLPTMLPNELAYCLTLKGSHCIY
jgi:hypothetical protein